MAFKTPSSFPEKPRSSHAPDGDGSRPAHIKSSTSVGNGHTDHEGRMPHPFSEEAPTSGSGEGKGH